MATSESIHEAEPVRRIDALLASFQGNTNLALAERDANCSYQQLYDKVCKAKAGLAPEPAVIGIQSEFAINAIALFLAHMWLGNRVALISPSARDVQSLAREATISRVHVFTDGEESAVIEADDQGEEHELLASLREQQAAGFIIFSSGSTGKPKAILHGLENFLTSFDNAKKQMRTLAFLLFDHIAGIDTLFYTLQSKGAMLIPADRGSATVCAMVEKHQAEVLPVSPSFLRLLYVSGEYRNYNLSSVKIVTFGSEPMSESGLASTHEMFPNSKVIQKYGTSEFGSPRSQSRGDDALWIRLDSDNVGTKIIDDTLWVKSTSSMLGYLNHPQPEIVDGWLNTGDKVIQDGEWIKILGRESDIINIGGEKVFPTEVENVISELEFVNEVSAFGEDHALMGKQLCVRISTHAPIEDAKQKKALSKAVRKHCVAKLESYKVPSKIAFTDQALTNERQKKIRR